MTIIRRKIPVSNNRSVTRTTGRKNNLPSAAVRHNQATNAPGMVNLAGGAGNKSRSRNVQPTTSTPKKRQPSGAGRSSYDSFRPPGMSSPISAKNAMVREDKRLTKSGRADLTFPVTKIKYMLKDGKYAYKVRTDAAVFMTAVLEYLTAEILELSGNACREEGKKRIQPTHILHGIRKDSDFKWFMKNTAIYNAGHVPLVNPDDSSNKS